jgi:hypothetical protein
MMAAAGIRAAPVTRGQTPVTRGGTWRRPAGRPAPGGATAS